MNQINRELKEDEIYRKGYQDGYNKAFMLMNEIKKGELETNPKMIVDKDVKL